MVTHITRTISYMFWIIIKYVAVPQPSPLSLYTKLEGPSTAKMDFYFPRYGVWMSFNGSLDFRGHSFWSVCKATLSKGCGHISGTANFIDNFCGLMGPEIITSS